MGIVQVEDEAHWRELRANAIGGSEVAALFDAHPQLTRFELWHRKKGTIPEPDLSDDQRIQAGKFLEPAIAAWTADRKDWLVQKVNYYLIHDDESVGLGGSLDYEIVGHERGPAVLEIKTADYLIFRGWEDGQPPLRYELQLQTYLCLTGRDWGAISVLVGGNDLRVFERERRPKTIKAIENASAEFWRSIEENKEPRPDFTMDGDVIARIYAEAQAGKVINVSNSNRMPILCSAYLQAHDIEKTASAQKEAARAEILHEIGDAAKAICNDFTISAPTVAGTHVEYDRAPFRQFRLTKRKEETPK